ncbi:MAG: DedA family protein [Phycisphaerae bacterium]
MELVYPFIDFFIHIDKHLLEIIQHYGAWTYPILFLIIFLETGVVVTPFLPGDSLLFAAGMFAGMGLLNPHGLFALLALAAVLGDTVNYALGHLIGPRVLRDNNSRIFRREYLDKTHAYFEKYGGMTIIIARFVPIVRTFAPFVAGVGAMTYTKFLAYNIIGGVLWVGLCVYGGYVFGQLPFVQKNFKWVVLAIIIVSVMPMVFEFLRARRHARASKPTAAPRRTPVAPTAAEPE